MAFFISSVGKRQNQNINPTFPNVTYLFFQIQVSGWNWISAVTRALVRGSYLPLASNWLASCKAMHALATEQRWKLRCQLDDWVRGIGCKKGMKIKSNLQNSWRGQLLAFSSSCEFHESSQVWQGSGISFLCCYQEQYDPSMKWHFK